MGTTLLFFSHIIVCTVPYSRYSFIHSLQIVEPICLIVSCFVCDVKCVRLFSNCLVSDMVCSVSCNNPSEPLPSVSIQLSCLVWVQHSDPYSNLGTVITLYRSDVFTAVRMMLFFWVLAPCRLVSRCKRVRNEGVKGPGPTGDGGGWVEEGGREEIGPLKGLPELVVPLVGARFRSLKSRMRGFFDLLREKPSSVRALIMGAALKRR
jgi:hypothetical protein